MSGGNGDYARSDAAIILEKTSIEVPWLEGEMPGSQPGGDTGYPIVDMFSGGMIEPPVHPKRAMEAVAANGHLAAVCGAVADGCAGVRYEIVPRFKASMMSGDAAEIDINDPRTWPEDAHEQRRTVQLLIQAGFLGDGAKSLRMGFRDQEHDRVILGWGGVVVLRDEIQDASGMPPAPKGFGKFEACYARFTRAQREPTMTPVPVALEDGTVWWLEEPRFFRRIRVVLENNHPMWFKEYGDWRSMSRTTGKYSTGARRIPPLKPGKPGKYTSGKLPGNEKQALEIAHWASGFPGVAPYGLSAWHSEMASADAWREHVQLVLQYLKCGLHSVILAASSRPFEQATMDAAVQKIDELGRGRHGLGALVTLALIPSESETSRPFGDDRTADRGRLILHELNTKLPPELLSSTFQDALAAKFGNAERVPAILLGRTESYNFATAAAAWMVVNRLRFGPHHEEREAFLNRILLEMGVTFWRLKVESPEWAEKEPLGAITAATGQLGGVTVNQAMNILSSALNVEMKPVDEWWGDVPMAIARDIIASQDPRAAAAMFGIELSDAEAREDAMAQAAAAAEKVQSGLDEAAARVDGQPPPPPAAPPETDEGA